MYNIHFIHKLMELGYLQKLSEILASLTNILYLKNKKAMPKLY